MCCLELGAAKVIGEKVGHKCGVCRAVPKAYAHLKPKCPALVETAL